MAHTATDEIDRIIQETHAAAGDSGPVWWQGHTPTHRLQPGHLNALVAGAIEAGRIAGRREGIHRRAVMLRALRGMFWRGFASGLVATAGGAAVLGWLTGRL